MQYLNWSEWLLIQCVCTRTSVYFTVRTSSPVVSVVWARYRTGCDEIWPLDSDPEVENSEDTSSPKKLQQFLSWNCEVIDWNINCLRLLHNSETRFSRVCSSRRKQQNWFYFSSKCSRAIQVLFCPNFKDKSGVSSKLTLDSLYWSPAHCFDVSSTTLLLWFAFTTLVVFSCCCCQRRSVVNHVAAMIFPFMNR